MNTHSKGNIGLGRAIKHFTSQGLVVSIPLTDSQPYDLVVDKDGSLLKVQVKYTTSNEVGLRTIDSSQARIKVTKFDNTKVDILFIATHDGIDIELDAKQIECKSSLSIKKYRPVYP